MDAIECITTRRSIRAFLPKPVSADIIEKVLAAASRSPSYTNSQPWEVAVVSGNKCKQMKKILGDLAGSNVPAKPDFPYPVTMPAEMTQRSLDHRIRRAHFLGMEFGTEGQARQNRVTNYDFYGASTVLLLFLDRTSIYYPVFDMGLFTQTLALTAHSYGLGTCIQAMLAAYPGAVRDLLEIPETKALLTGVSIGYADPGAKTNEYVSNRIGPEKFAKWYE